MTEQKRQYLMAGVMFTAAILLPAYICFGTGEKPKPKQPDVVATSVNSNK